MKELIASLLIIVVIIAIMIGNIYPQYDILCGWIMIAGLIACACTLFFYPEDDEH